VVVLEVSQVVELVLTKGRDDLGVGDDIHDSRRLRLELAEGLDDRLLPLAELCRRERKARTKVSGRVD
jgi:hypothetical protein